MSPKPLPSNVHVSSHPCLQAKLSQLRSCTNARETNALLHEISVILGVEATASALKAESGEESTTILGHAYTTTHATPSTISLIPILRSGLAMLPALQLILPTAVPIHHLGLFREPTTLEPVEYYNNLPFHRPTPSNPSNKSASQLAILLDPVIATGGTCAAAIQTLKEWGVERVLVISVLGAVEGIERAAREWSDGTQIWVAGVDEGISDKGMIVPGVGDVGDRLFLTIGK